MMTKSATEVQRSFERGVILPLPAHSHGGSADKEPSALTRQFLMPFGFSSRWALGIADLNLERGYIVVANSSRWSVNMTGMYLCNEERRHAFNFPRGFKLKPHAQVMIYCGVTAPLSPSKEDAGDETLYWEHDRYANVLNRTGDAMYLWDGQGRICSALAKSEDNQYKRYGPSTKERTANSFYNLALTISCLRLASITGAACCGLCPLLAGSLSDQTAAEPSEAPEARFRSLGNGAGELNLEVMLFFWAASFALDLCERVAAERSGAFRQPLAHSLSVFGDRLLALQLFGGLALAYSGSASACFLTLGAMDLASSWFQGRAAGAGVDAQPALLGALATSFPQALSGLCLSSEAFLLLALVSHPELWPTVSTYPVPPLLWSRNGARLLAFACVCRQILTLLQLQLAASSLLLGQGVGSSGAYGGRAGAQSPGAHVMGDREGEVPLPGSDMAAVSALVKGRIPSLSDSPRRLQARALLEPKQVSAAGRSVLETRPTGRSKRGVAQNVQGAGVDSDDESGDEDGGSPERPNLNAMRSTRLSSLRS